MEVYYNSPKNNLIFIPLRCGTSQLYRLREQTPGLIYLGDLGPLEGRKAFVKYYTDNYLQSDHNCTALIRDPFYRLLSVYHAFHFNASDDPLVEYFWEGIPNFLQHVSDNMMQDPHLTPQTEMYKRWDIYEKKDDITFINVANYAEWIHTEFNIVVEHNDSQLNTYLRNFSGNVYHAMMFYDFVKTHYHEDYALMQEKRLLPGYVVPVHFTTDEYLGRKSYEPMHEMVHLHDEVLLEDAPTMVNDYQGEMEHEHFQLRISSPVHCLDDMQAAVPEMENPVKKPRVRVAASKPRKR